ncbi:hypothetical protein ON010_g16076 [Phytophthora cinnamomi]|nr:hypothetical protein ON010_g16076 [Phytophthora cinnamomi]
MEETSVPQNFGELLEALGRQQFNFQALMQHQFAVSEARLDALASKPPAARKAQPPTYRGKLTEDLELWVFTIEQYYADYHPPDGGGVTTVCHDDFLPSGSDADELVPAVFNGTYNTVVLQLASDKLKLNVIPQFTVVCALLHNMVALVGPSIVLPSLPLLDRRAQALFSSHDGRDQRAPEFWRAPRSSRPPTIQLPGPHAASVCYGGGVTTVCHDDFLPSGSDADELVPAVFNGT